MTLTNDCEKNVKSRGFELVTAYQERVELLPKRETSHAAGYDLKAAENVTINPGEIVLIPTGLKAYMEKDEVLFLYDRSSNPIKQGIVLMNSVGVIDHDYYNNPNNEGLMYGQFTNITKEPITIEAGTRIMQGVFSKFLTVDNDEAKGQRTGGFGSTGK
jgi:deoxyuridine 5''-triphosphate nucleotidohydrolase (dut)